MDIRLLEKYYRGECSKQEVREVLSWFESESDKQHVLRHLQDSWQQFKEGEEVIPQHDPDVLLNRIHARLKKDRGRSGEVKKGDAKSGNINRFYFLRIAAIIALAFGLSFLVQKKMPSRQLLEVNPLVVKEVPKGQKLTLILADGTRVSLNADSRLSYPETFLANKREVMLEGEAFFEVTRDATRPFIITSRDVCTTVLGTSFNVKAYGNESQISVSVASGKVRVSRLGFARQAHYLSPGIEAVYQSDKKSFTVQDFKTKERLAWKKGILYFKDATFEEVKKALERWYGVEIQVAGKGHQGWQYSGTFERQSLENVLLSIGYVKHFTYEMDGRQVKIILNNPKETML